MRVTDINGELTPGVIGDTTCTKQHDDMEIRFEEGRTRIVHKIADCTAVSSMQAMIHINGLFNEGKLLFHSPFHMTRRASEEYVTPNIVAHWNVRLSRTLPMISTTMINSTSTMVAADVGVVFDMDDTSSVFVHMLGSGDLMFRNPGSYPSVDAQHPWDFNELGLVPSRNLKSAKYRVKVSNRGTHYNRIYEVVNPDSNVLSNTPSESAMKATKEVPAIVASGSFNEAVISANVSGIKAVVCMRTPTEEDMKNMTDLACALDVECLYFNGGFKDLGSRIKHL